MQVDVLITDGIPADHQLELAVAAFSGAVGDLRLTYLRVASSIEDFGGNSLQDSGSIPVDLDVTPPVMIGVASSSSHSFGYHL